MASSSSTSAEPTPPWEKLPRELTAAILQKLGAVEILRTAQRVCTTWRSVCRDPSMWRCIDMRWETTFDSDKICRHAVDRCCGQLIEISIDVFGTDDLLLYVSQRSSKLKFLQLVSCNGITYEGLIEAIKNFPLLEELHLYSIYINEGTIATIGRCCPFLKSLKFKDNWGPAPDMVAQAIAENMSGLCHLQLVGNRMTDEGLKAILEGCPNLESLDLRRCSNVLLSGDLGKLCSERFKDLKLPRDPIHDYEFPGTYYDETSDDEPGCSDMDVDHVVSDYENYLEYSAFGYDYPDNFFLKTVNDGEFLIIVSSSVIS